MKIVQSNLETSPSIHQHIDVVACDIWIMMSASPERRYSSCRRTTDSWVYKRRVVEFLCQTLWLKCWLVLQYMPHYAPRNFLQSKCSYIFCERAKALCIIPLKELILQLFIGLMFSEWELTRKIIGLGYLGIFLRQRFTKGKKSLGHYFGIFAAHFSFPI